MKNIVLDTNIIHQEGLFSGRMELLEKLVSNKKINIYIPDVVRREFITKRISELSDAVKSAQSNLKTVSRKLNEGNKLKAISTSAEKELTELANSLKDSVNQDFEKWTERLNISIISSDNIEIGCILDDYFSGQGAFKSPKNREDFPDSIIYHSVLKLSEEIGELYIILADSAFKKGIEGKGDIITLSSLNELFKIKDIEEFLSNEELKGYFLSEGFSELLKMFFSQQRTLIEEIYVSGDIDNLELLGIRTFGSELNFPSPTDISELTISEFYSISDTYFTADIAFITDASLHFVGDYFGYSELERNASRYVTMDSMDGDGICDLYEQVSALFSGKINFHFDDKYSIKDIDLIIKNLVHDTTHVDITLDIDNAFLMKTIK